MGFYALTGLRLKLFFVITILINQSLRILLWEVEEYFYGFELCQVT